MATAAPTQELPLFYNALEALNSGQHGKMKIRRIDKAPIMGSTHAVPVTVDEFQIGNAETYDVIIRPAEDKAFTLVAESIDRSGMARATLAPRMGMTARRSAAVCHRSERP